MNEKYEITDISHPDYPHLHRVRALREIDADIHKGDLGGYVQSRENLSQKDSCWIFGDAIACGEALVSQYARVSGHAVICGSALVSGGACVSRNAVIEDQAMVLAGTVGGDCFISGNACLAQNPKSNVAPSVTGRAAVYGMVYGSVMISGDSVILPGVKIDMPTRDVLEIRDGRVCLHRFRGWPQNTPAKNEQRTMDNGPER